jgi:hypothetical protein
MAELSMEHAPTTQSAATTHIAASREGEFRGGSVGGRDSRGNSANCGSTGREEGPVTLHDIQLSCNCIWPLFQTPRCEDIRVPTA